MKKNHYDVLIVGGGISGTALFYELAKYTNVQSLCLLEKYEALATLNTKATSNSQTIHIGDIETNYTLEKAKVTKRTAKMVEKFCLQYGLQDKIMFKHQKMALGVGEKEVHFIENRYQEFKELFPYLELWDIDKLKEVEPKVVYTDKAQTQVRPEPIVAIGTNTQYTTCLKPWSKKPKRTKRSLPIFFTTHKSVILFKKRTKPLKYPVKMAKPIRQTLWW